MQIAIAPRSREIERPWYVWPAVVLEVLTGLLAIPVGWSSSRIRPASRSGYRRVGSSPPSSVAIWSQASIYLR